MKIVIFTRTAFHHTAFINRLQERFGIACVVRESYPLQKKEHPLRSALRGLLKPKDRKDDTSFLEWFNEKFSAGFRFSPLLGKYLGSPFDVVVEKPGTKYLDIGCGEINTDAFASFLREAKPDIVAVLGSSVIKPLVISVPRTAMINLHSGLSPYYRGTWSFGWPIVNKEPQYIGATVHHIAPGIDNGEIIFQTRPLLAEDDDLNRIFLKVIAEGIELVADAVDALVTSGSVKSFPQPVGEGKLYLCKDFNAAAARLCLANLEEGLLKNYISRKREADSAVRLYGYVPPRAFERG